MYVLQTLGAVALHPGPTLDLTGEPLLRGSKTLVLATYLAGRPDRSATREHLAELFWPAVPSSQARRSLRQALYYLAQSGGEGILESDGELVRLDRDCCSLDAQLFEQALREERFEDAIELYTGPFLQGFDPGKSRELATWIESVRERLEVGYRQALRESGRTALLRGDFERAVAYARRAADTFPLDDSVHALLLEALTAAGRPGEAVREFEAYRVLLREELEDVPSGDITEIAERAREMVLERPGGDGPGIPLPAGRVLVDGEPLPDRFEPEPTRAIGPVGPMLMILMSLAIVAAVVAVLLNWFDVGRAGSGLSGNGGAADEPAKVLLRVSEEVPGGNRYTTLELSLIHISEPTRLESKSRLPASAG